MPTLEYELPANKKYAYVTLLYNDDFAFAVRTLGQSLRETRNPTRSNIDHLVLVTAGVSPGMQDLLETDGWTTKRVQQAPNPNARYDKRLKGVYTKMELFRLMDYHRLVYLDADTTLLENVDELFLCGPFCAVMRHSELINTGVMVIEPSLELHADVIEKVGQGLYSYTGGDQGFLNSYYEDYAACPYFEPMKKIGLDGSNDNNLKKCRRLPHRYNGDWPIAMLNGKLEMVRTKNSMQAEFGEFRRSRILHYTVGSFKPWDWYAPALFPFTYCWTTVAARLPKTPADQRQHIYELFWIILGASILALWLALIFHASSSYSQGGGTSSSPSGISLRQPTTNVPTKQMLSTILKHLRKQLSPRNNNAAYNSAWARDPLSAPSLALHLLAGYLYLVLGMAIGFKMVPIHTHDPIMGFGIFLTWTFAIFFSLYSLYLYRWYLQGHDVTKNNASSSDDEAGGGSVSLPLFSPRTTNSISPRKNPSSMAAARAESLTCAGGLVAFVVCFVMVRIHAHTDTPGQVLPPLLGLAVTVILGLTIAFYRLPLLWYQEGLSV
jgi:hypothetical protein